MTPSEKQDRLDKLVGSNPCSSTDTLRKMWRAAGGLDADFNSMCRWPPNLKRPKWADTPKVVKRSTPDPKPQRTRAYTPLIADLERRLQAGPQNPRPTGHVDNGQLPYEKDDDNE